MSRENVDVVRRAFEAATRRPEPDVEALTELSHPDHRLINDYGAMGSDAYGERRIPKGARGIQVDWAEWHQEFDDFLEAGAQAVLLVHRAE
jgi:hypothetical protein